MNEKQTKVLHRLMDYANENNLYIDWYPGCAEPGYDDVQMLAADWNPERFKFQDKGFKHSKTSKIAQWIETYFNGDLALEWSDEWASCGDCYKAVRTSPDSYGWEPYYIMFHAELVCGDCMQENPADGIEAYMNSTSRAIPSWFIESAENEGFYCILDDPYYKDQCKRFETGFHPGQNDTPEKALEEIYEVVSEKWFHENMDYLFAITSRGQFDLHWTVLVRKKV